MSGRARGQNAILYGLIPAIAVGIVVSGCSTLGYSQQLGRSRSGASECFSDTFGGRRDRFESFATSEYADIARRCRNLAQEPSTNRLARDTIYANFYAGKAARLDGEKRGASPGDAVWSDARTALSYVVDFRRPITVPRNTPAELTYALTRVEAEVELALVHLNAGRKDEARDWATAATKDYEALVGDVVFTNARDAALRGRVNAASVLARVYRMAPASDIDAIRALLVYLDQSLDGSDAALVARKDIVDTASRLGETELEQNTPQSLSVAQAYFNLALDAGTAMRRRDRSLSLSNIYINLGRANMALANRRGPDFSGGCELVVSDQYLVKAALEMFNQAQRESSITRQWLGCAEMAAGNLNEAVDHFRAAAESGANTPDAQISLARALYQAATTEGTLNKELSWQDSRKSFRLGLGRLPVSNDMERKKKSGIHLEFAKVNLDYLQRTPNLPQRARAEVIQETRQQLNAAIQLPPNAEARLRLAAIDLGDFGTTPNLDAAGDNIKIAIDGDRASGDTLAEAHYLRSRLAVLRYEGRDAPSDVAKKAIDDADRAVQENIGSKTEQAYVANACMARLSFQRSGDSEGFCRANESLRDSREYNYPRAAAYEGMYFLREAYNANSMREQDKAWESAYVAFNKGLTRLRDLGRDADWTNDLARERAFLLTGRGLALFCTGLIDTGRADLDAPPAALRSEAEREFDRYKVYRCAPRKART